MHNEPLNYQNAADSRKLTRFETGVQVGQKTLLFSALGFVAGIAIWVLLPAVIVFLAVGSVAAVIMTRGRSVCGWIGMGIVLYFAAVLIYLLATGR